MKQKGFTLIELIVVIVILGILAATALPKFADLSGEANDAAAKGLAGGIASGAAILYATDKAKSTAVYTQAGACDGSQLQSFNLGACTTALLGSTCTVTCGTKTATAVLP